MEPFKKRKHPDDDFNMGDATGEEGSSSDQAARNDWRDRVHSSTRFRSRAIIVEALHENNSLMQFPVDEAITIGTKVEVRFFGEAASEHDYLAMVSAYQKHVRTQEISKVFGTDMGSMPTQLNQNNSQNASMAMADLFTALKRQKVKATDSVENVLQRHIETTYYFKNLLLLFNMRQPKGQRLAVRLHQLKASIEFSNSLDNLTEQLESLQNLPEMNELSKAVEINVVDAVYEALVQESLEMFSNHIKNICDCSRVVTVVDEPCSSHVDLTSQRRHSDNTDMEKPPLQPGQQPADLCSDDTRNTILPQQQAQLLKQQSGTSKDQTDTSFDYDLLAEYRVLLNITDED